MSKARQPWPLPDLLAANRNAATVYATLLWMAGGKRQVKTIRKRITDACGLSPKRITSAVSALAEAGWITLRYGHKNGRQWYCITLPKDANMNPRTEGLKTTPSKKNRTAKNDPQCAAHWGSKNDPHSLKRVGRPRRAAFGASAGGSVLTHSDGPVEAEHPADKAEREGLAHARAEREARERGESETKP